MVRALGSPELSAGRCNPRFGRVQELLNRSWRYGLRLQCDVSLCQGDQPLSLLHSNGLLELICWSRHEVNRRAQRAALVYGYVAPKGQTTFMRMASKSRS